MSTDLQEAVGATLRASAELSREQELLDQDAEQAPAARDYAVRNLVKAFKRFEVGAHPLNHETPSHAKDETLRLDCARLRERGARAVDG